MESKATGHVRFDPIYRICFPSHKLINSANARTCGRLPAPSRTVCKMLFFLGVFKSVPTIGALGMWSNFVSSLLRKMGR